MLGPDKGPTGPGCLTGAEPVDWQFLQCFGERTPGEEVQEGEAWPGGANRAFGGDPGSLGRAGRSEDAFWWGMS